jgi:hypothetical protein
MASAPARMTMMKNKVVNPAAVTATCMFPAALRNN